MRQFFTQWLWSMGNFWEFFMRMKIRNRSILAFRVSIYTSWYFIGWCWCCDKILMTHIALKIFIWSSCNRLQFTYKFFTISIIHWLTNRCLRSLIHISTFPIKKHLFFGISSDQYKPASKSFHPIKLSKFCINNWFMFIKRQ